MTNPIVQRRLDALREPARFEDVWSLSLVPVDRDVPVIRAVTWERPRPKKREPAWRKAETWLRREGKAEHVPTDTEVAQSIERQRRQWSRAHTETLGPCCHVSMKCVDDALARERFARRYESVDWISPQRKHWRIKA